MVSMKYDTGFSLVELLVTMALVAIIMFAAAPPMADMMKNNRLVGHTTTFVRSLNVARSEAVNRATNVVLCPSTDGTGCDVVGWESGWIIYVDGDSDGAYGGAPDDTIIHVEAALSGTTTITARAATTYATNIIYTPRGFTTSAGELIVCDDRDDLAFSKAIAVSGTGRPQSMLNNQLAVPFGTCGGA